MARTKTLVGQMTFPTPTQTSNFKRSDIEVNRQVKTRLSVNLMTVVQPPIVEIVNGRKRHTNRFIAQEMDVNGEPTKTFYPNINDILYIV